MRAESEFVVVQFCDKVLKLGPFFALDSGMADVLFESALRIIPLGTRIFLDTPVSNDLALRLFNRTRIRIAEETCGSQAGLPAEDALRVGDHEKLAKSRSKKDGRLFFVL